MDRRLQPSLVLATLCGTLSTSAGQPLRELSTDRPDTTESPISVDKGHFQFESELAAFTRDGGEWSEFTLGELNAKCGLTDCADIQFVLPFFRHVRGGDEGFGNMEVRLKYNLWGNDGGETAMALMPFVKLPTADGDLGNGEFEGGLIAPFAFSVPGGWSCAVMGEIDLACDADDDHQLVGLVSATASHGITETTAGFLEMVGMFTTGSSDDIEAYFNTGFTWEVAANWQLDGGVRIGLTGASADFTPFLGLSTRF